jgi:hypothetical protein
MKMMFLSFLFGLMSFVPPILASLREIVSMDCASQEMLTLAGDR